jgi:SSS family transporter
MRLFTMWDWIVVVVYLAGIIVFGVWIGRGQKTTRDYFLGSRNVPWWGVGLSIIATETSALTFIGVPAMAYGGDLSFIQIILGYVVARIILAGIMVPHYFRGEVYSPYQLITRAFGPSAGRLTGGLFLLSGTLAAGVRVYVTSIPLQLMLGISLFWAVILFVLLSWIYTCSGGIKAVIWTDAIQMVLFLAGGAFTLVYLGMLMPGGWTAAMTQAGAEGKLHWLNTSFGWGMPFNVWMGVLGGTVQVMSSHGADQLIVQRVLSCKGVADGRRALMLSAVLILPIFLMFLLVGTMLWAYYQQHPLRIPLPANQAGLKQNDYLFPIFILTEMPPVLRGLLVVAVLSAAMSSISSALSALASVSTMDFAGWMRRSKGAAEPGLLGSRLATLFWAVMLVLVAYASREAELVLNLAFSLNGITSGALLSGLLLALFAPRTAPGAVLIGLLCSVGTLVGIQLVVGQAIAWPWYALIGTGAGLLTAAGASSVIAACSGSRGR